MKGRKRRMQWIGLALLAAVILYLGVQGILCAAAMRRATLRLESFGAKTAELSYGSMAYVDSGAGEPVLAIHGICGGYDQIYEDAQNCLPGKRIIAPSRFGYPGSDAPEDPSPEKQADAFAELLDALEIDSAYLMATSAGGTSAIRFALKYPERTKGLILVSSAMPLMEKPESFLEYQGPPAAILNNYMMYLVSPLFPAMMGVEPSMIDTILPMEKRSEGTKIDASISNPDMARNFDQYPVEELKVKTIIFHAKDDKLASYSGAEKAAARFPDATFVPFETGGHKLEGHAAEIVAALAEFTK